MGTPAPMNPEQAENKAIAEAKARKAAAKKHGHGKEEQKGAADLDGGMASNAAAVAPSLRSLGVAAQYRARRSETHC